ncbi:MAG: hypothetical protein ABSC57_10710 [Syntrophales bacterium]|jgi:hypothetical protein
MKKKNSKHPKDMTNDELLAHVFHPKVVERIKKHVEDLNAVKEKPSKKVDK